MREREKQLKRDFWTRRQNRGGDAVMALFSSQPGVWQPGILHTVRWALVFHCRSPLLTDTTLFSQVHANRDVTLRCGADGWVSNRDVRE